MSQGRSFKSLRPVVLVALVLFAFWRPLVAGGSLVPDDQLWRTDPFNADPPEGITIEVAEPDAIAIHSAWARWGADVRAGDLSWWQEAGGGRPFLADGLPITHLAYALVPGWYAPGLVAALAVLLAALGAMALADHRRLHPAAGLFAGIAFGFSGLVFVWLGWPHATAIALVPWVVRAASRVAADPAPRTVAGLAAAVALQLWAGVFAIVAFTVVGAMTWVLLETSRDRLRAAATGLAAGVGTGAALAAPHLLPRWRRWSWADTSAVEAVGDTSADLAALATAPFGSILGHDAVGVPWLADGTFQQSIVFVGVSTFVLALTGAAATTRRRAPLAVLAVGIAFAFVGGPLATIGTTVAGAGAELGHARPLVVLAFAILAAHGLDAIATASEHRAIRERIRTVPLVWIGVSTAAVLGMIALAVTAVVDGRAVRLVAAELLDDAVIAGVFVAVLVGWWRRWLAASGVTVAALALVTYELLAFGMPIPTVTPPDERLEVTAAHTTLQGLLGDDGRVAGDLNAFEASTAARFGYGDVRAPDLRSAGEIAAFTDVDPSATFAAVGGSPFAPIIRTSDDVDPSRHPTWALLGVDAWVLPFDATPPGPRTEPTIEARSPVATASPIGSVMVPEHGLRGLLVDLRTPPFTTVRVDVTAGGEQVAATVVLRTARDGVVGFAVPGEGLPPGAEARVVVNIDPRGEAAEVGVAGGGVALGTVGGETDRFLVWSDGVLILSQPTPRAVWEGAAEAVVTLDTAGPDAVAVRIDADQPGAVRFDIVDEPGWEASIDGRRVAHRTIAETVLGVDVPAGSSAVEVRYRPPGFGVGVVIALAGAVALAAAWLLDRRRASTEA